jgi:hypothetical protein
MYRLLFCGIILTGISACKKEDAIDPVIRLNGGASVSVVLNTPYVDAGATASDDIDGDITSEITLDSTALNHNHTGNYTLIYSVSDKTGNSSSVERVVNVRNESTYFQGNYSVTTHKAGSVAYTDMISASTTKNNRLTIARFANYSNASVYFDISGYDITIPSQTMVCGNPEIFRTFAGTGVINGKLVTLNFTEEKQGTIINGTSSYIKN